MGQNQVPKTSKAARIAFELGRILSHRLLRRAALAMQSHDYGEALKCWSVLLRRAIYLPQCYGPQPYYMVSALAREVGDLKLCGEVVEKGINLFPYNDFMVVEAAMLAARLGQWDRSVALWSRIIDQPHADPIWLTCYAHDLMMLGNVDFLDTLLPSYRSRFPEHRGFLAVQGMVAAMRSDYDNALAIWSDYRRIYPNDPVGWDHYGRIRQTRELELLENASTETKAELAGPARAKIDVIVEDATRMLLLGFESIGSTCEFGLVQRRFGAEPFGLLRFNSTLFGSLISAVTHRFDGMGSPENTELTISSNGEFYIADRRWHLGMHTFLFDGQVDPAQLYEKMCRRVTFLRNKMLEDLMGAQKVFVFLDSKVSLEDIQMLHLALRTIGDIVLLHVRSLDAERGGFPSGSVGEVVEIAPNQFVGFLSSQGQLPNNRWDIQFDEWIAICRKIRSVIDYRKTSMTQETQDMTGSEF